MPNSSGSSQCDPELAIPDIFWDIAKYQAIGSERQIFSVSVNKNITRVDSGSSRITKVSMVSNKYMKCGVLLTQVF